MLNHKQKKLIKIATLLHLKGQVPYEVILPGGAVVKAEALIENLMGHRGALFFTSGNEPSREVMEELSNIGFGVTWYGEELSDSVDQEEMEGFMEMFSEWGWTGSESEKPEWMSGPGDIA